MGSRNVTRMMKKLVGLTETLAKLVNELHGEVVKVADQIDQLPITKDGKLAFVAQILWRVGYKTGEVQPGVLFFALDEPTPYKWCVRFDLSDGSYDLDSLDNCYVDRDTALEELARVTNSD